MMTFTAAKFDSPETAHIVLAVSNEKLLLAGPEDRLEWVPASLCILSKLFMDHEQREWWNRLAPPAAEEAHEHV